MTMAGIYAIFTALMPLQWYNDPSDNTTSGKSETTTCYFPIGRQQTSVRLAAPRFDSL
jgi:hypothetical protein